jgi:tetratricopeptide (TPR) repeat protein
VEVQVAGFVDDLRGRDAELAAIRERMRAAVAGRGDLVVVRGDAGIGKSALVDVIIADAAGQGVRTVVGRAWEFADAPAYFPVRGLLRALGVSPSTPAASEADAFGLWEDVLECLTTACAASPLLCVVEDLHAADVQTVELLSFLARPIRGLAVLIVVTVRTGDVRATEPVLRRLLRLVRDGSTVDLAPLGEADVRAIASRVAGHPLVGSVDRWMERTGGNPLFVVECARAVRYGTTLESALPETLVQSVVDRLEALPTSTRGFLERGAIVGREFAASTVARLDGRLPAMVIDGLLAALRARLVEETSPGRYRFAHALVHAAVEAAIEPSRRRELHAAVEAVLGQQGGTDEVVVERARHGIEGLGPVDEAHAAALVAGALDTLGRQGARDRAYALWRRWLDARRDPPAGDDWLRLARLATSSGRHVDALAAAEAAAAIARRTEDPNLLAEATLAMGAGQLPATVNAAYVRALEEALSSLSADDEPRLGCRLRARLAAAMQPAVDPTVPVAMARQAVTDARAIGDEALLREVLLLAGSALGYYTSAAEVHALSGELLTAARAVGDDEQALRAYGRRVVTDLDLGDFASWDADTDGMLALARRVGHPSLVWRAAILGSMRALARGQLEDSERFVAEVEQCAGLTDDPALGMVLASHRFHRVLCLDDEVAMRALAAGPLARIAALAGAYGAVVTAAVAVRLEDPALAAPQLPALLGLLAAVPPDSALHGSVGEAVALAGTDAQRAELLARLRQNSGRELHTAPVPQTYEGPVDRVIGLLEASLGRTDAADATLETARAHCRRHGLRPWVARLSLERGRVLRGRPEARALLEEAAALADELGMTATSARARRELGGPPVVEPPVAATAASVRMVQEGEVWRVVLGDEVARVRDSRGVQLLAKLVASPGEGLHALVLAGDGDEPVPDGDAGPAVDKKALAAYRARLSTVDDALAAAESSGDGRRYDALDRERRMLVAEISRAVGLGGRLRPVGSATERARINVTRRLKDAIARIAASNPAIGQHLSRAVRTGTTSSYDPR